MNFDVDISVDTRDDEELGREPEARSFRSNIILVGGTGAGKSTTGWVLARLIGAGFIDLDRAIEAKEKKSVQQIFDTHGEAYFRRAESDLVASLYNLRSHVLVAGGGALVDDENWRLLSEMGVLVWINTPPDEIARRLLARPDELKKRPLLADVLEQKDAEARVKLLAERLKALIGNRVDRYKKANLVVTDSFSTPESTARLVKELLTREGLLAQHAEQRPFDRWGIL